jgi:hypothetical protein
VTTRRPFRLSRRTLLRAGGYTLALPWLEAMAGAPRAARAQGAAARALFVYFPSGYTRGHWTSSAGASGPVALPALARALEPWQRKLTLITGLANQPAAEIAGNAGGIHARGTGCSLVCQPLRETGFTGDGVSADQVIVRALGGSQCLSSLVLGLPNERAPSLSEEGYGSIYYNNVSFTGPRSPVQKLNNPSDLFLRLVTCPGFGSRPRDEKRARFEQGVMGSVKAQADRLMSCAGQGDRLRLEEFFTSITELERRFTAPPAAACAGLAAAPPAGTTLREAAVAMMDLAVLAFRCGLTRVGTLMMDGAMSRRSFGLPDIGGANYIHGLSHGEIGGEEADNPRWLRITAHYFELFAHLLARMDAVDEGGRTLLDNSVVFIGSEFGDGNAHQVGEQPVIIAGGGGGRLRMGQRIAARPGTPKANALLDVMLALGVQRTAFGDSTGTVPGLAA